MKLDLRNFPSLHFFTQKLKPCGLSIELQVLLFDEKRTWRRVKDNQTKKTTLWAVGETYEVSVDKKEKERKKGIFPYSENWIINEKKIKYSLRVNWYKETARSSVFKDGIDLTFYTTGKSLYSLDQRERIEIDFLHASVDSHSVRWRYSIDAKEPLYQAKKNAIDLAVEKIPLKYVLLFNEMNQIFALAEVRNEMD